jgi:hypothetical protein
MWVVLHSALRWVVVAAVVGRLGLAARGMATGAPLGARDRQVGLVSVITMDLQLTLGLVLLAVSPLAQAAFADMGGAMKDPILRFWSVEHPTLMVAAVGAVHVGHRVSSRAAEAGRGHRAALIGYGIALLALVAAIPWPFRAGVGRPWLSLP